MEIGFVITFLIGNVFFYVIGNVFLNILFAYVNMKRPNQTLEFGLSIMIGFLFSSSLIACVKTNFNTILNYQFLIFICIIFIGIYRKSIKINLILNKKIIFYIVISYIVFLLLFSLKKNNFHYDFIYWGKLSKSIYSVGVESLDSLFDVFITSKKTMLYHYGDYWITGFITAITEESEIYTLIYVVYPILISTSILVITGILENKLKNPIISFTLAFGVIFANKIFIGSHNDILNPLLSNYRGIYEAAQFKTSIIYFPLLISFYFYKLNHQRLSLIFLTISTFLYPTITICISITIFLLSFFYILNNNKTKKNKLFVLILLATYISYALFLKIKATNPHLKLELEIKDVKFYVIQLIELNYKLFYETLIPTLSILIYFVFIYFKQKISVKINSFVFSISLYLGITVSMFFVVIHKPFVDNSQIINNSTPVFLTIFFIELILAIDSRKFMLFLLFTLIINMVFNYFKSNIENNSKFKNNLNISISKKFKIQSINKINQLKNINSIYFSNIIHNDYIYIPSNKFDFLSKEYNFDLPFFITSLSFFRGDNKFNVNGEIYNFDERSKLRNFIKEYKVNIIITESKWNQYIEIKLKDAKLAYEIMAEEKTNSKIFFLK